MILEVAVSARRIRTVVAEVVGKAASLELRLGSPASYRAIGDGYS
jgi:hypothetical protein